MPARCERSHRVVLYRGSRSELLRRSRIRPVPSTLSWIEARQKAPLSPEPPPPDRPEFYTREAAARRLGVSKTTVWELTSRGVIGVAYIGSKPLIPAVEPDRYIASLVEQARERAQAMHKSAKRRA